MRHDAAYGTNLGFPFSRFGEACDFFAQPLRRGREPHAHQARARAVDAGLAVRSLTRSQGERAKVGQGTARGLSAFPLPASCRYFVMQEEPIASPGDSNSVVSSVRRL